MTKWTGGLVFDQTSYDAIKNGDIPLALEIDAAIQPLLAIEARLRKLGVWDGVASGAAELVWLAVRSLQSAQIALEEAPTEQTPNRVPPADSPSGK